jgi:outer membrane lipoprotein-sorting protein
MNSLIPTKKILIITLFLTTFASCQFWRQSSNSNSTLSSDETGKIENEFPFTIQEPKDYQAEIIIKANDEEQKMFVARKGENRLIKYDVGEKGEFSVVSIDGKVYLVNANSKTFAENETYPSNVNGENWLDFLTNEKLSQKSDATFESLGIEGNLNKYRVISGDSEIMLWIDKENSLPIKQEFYDAEKVLQTSIEMKNIKFETDTNLFEISKDFRKVTAKEFQEASQNIIND